MEGRVKWRRDHRGVVIVDLVGYRLPNAVVPFHHLYLAFRRFRLSDDFPYDYTGTMFERICFHDVLRAFAA